MSLSAVLVDIVVEASEVDDAFGRSAKSRKNRPGSEMRSDQAV